MHARDVIHCLSFYFPNAFAPTAGPTGGSVDQEVVDRLLRMPDEPLGRTHFNQLLHLSHEAGVSAAFFDYYFLEEPQGHPYPVDALLAGTPSLNSTGIASLEQLRFGLHRFFVDSLLFFPSFRAAYAELRNLSRDQLAGFFASRKHDTEEMQRRGPTLPLKEIPTDDRYLIAELACKAYTPRKGSPESLVEIELVRAYRSCGKARVAVKELIGMAQDANQSDLQAQMSFMFSCEEFIDAVVESDEQLKEKVRGVAARFNLARGKALQNTAYYLSIVNELDVYVATSMRNRQDFRDMSRSCAEIFNAERLRPLRLRYFDPTNSAASSHEDKGLIECLMVKCSKALLYFAGQGESFGKDVEAAMALSLGKPVIICCPQTAEGDRRMRFFRDIHPLSRLIDVSTGVSSGAITTSRLEHVVELLDRIFTNRMEYDLEQDGDGYFRLLERLTRSVVRVQTNWKILRESFWNYYHRID